MKNLIKQSALVAVAMTATLQVHAAEPTTKPFATCIDNSATEHEVSTYRIFVDDGNPLGSIQSRIEVQMNDESEPRILATIFGMGSWITYRANFILFGENMKLEFSNYRSPSIGTLTTLKGAKEVACAFQDPEEGSVTK